MTSLAKESELLSECRELAERGRYQDLLERLAGLERHALEERTPFALLAAEANGRLGRHTEAGRWAETALRAARARGERHAELRAGHYQGAIALTRGDVDEAEAHFLAALDMARALGDHAAQARCFNNLGIIADLRGEPETALASYELALAAYQQAGLVRGIAETHHNVGISRRDLRDLRGALAAADEALRLATQIRDEPLIARLLAFRAELHILLGDPDLAEAELARATETYERARYRAELPEVWRLEAAVARRRGDLDRAVRLLERAAEAAGREGNAYNLVDIERDLGAALEARGDAAGARAARQRAVALYRRLGAKKAAQEIAALLARPT